jgi:hypothetical protein
VPLLFALCSAGQQQGGATCSFQYRFFQHGQVTARGRSAQQETPKKPLRGPERRCQEPLCSKS